LLDDKDKTLLKMVRKVDKALATFPVSFSVRSQSKSFQRDYYRFNFEPSQKVIDMFKKAANRDDVDVPIEKNVEINTKETKEKSKGGFSFFGL
jgi:hypothetical protein